MAISNGAAVVIVLEFLFRSYISKKFCGITVEETVESKLRVRATYTHSRFSICYLPNAWRIGTRRRRLHGCTTRRISRRKMTALAVPLFL